MKTWQLWLRLMGYAPGTLAVMLFLQFLRMVIQFAPALVIRRLFTVLPRSAGLTPELWLLVALLVGLALAQVVIFVSAAWFSTNFQDLGGALLRRNAVEGIYRRPAAQALPMPVGDVVTRIGPGIPQITKPLVFVLAQLLNALTVILAIGLMARTNLALAAVALAPLAVAALVAQQAGARMAQLRRASLAADGQIGTFLREIFSAVQLVQVAGAEERAARRFVHLNELRRKRVLQESLFQDVLIASLVQNAAYLSTGLLLLLSWRYMLAGTFTISDFALFTYFLPIISDFSMSIGESFRAYKQAEACFERLCEAAGGQPAEPGPPADLSRYQPVYLTGPLPESPLPAPPGPDDRLESLSISGLTCLHPGSGRGIHNISLRVEAGSFTAITGRVGAGKTTFLRALLGLLSIDAGEIRWNGQIVRCPASFFIPPRVAYVRQSPGLFSTTLRENLLLGLPSPGLPGFGLPNGLPDGLPGPFADRLDLALQAAVLEADLPALEHGLDTRVGPRGVKLSGGQIQRAAAARALARPASLLILDDLSSALDMETERLLWERIQALGVTLLVASHRREVLKRADRIIVLKEGRVEAEGSLEALLETCEEMQALWGEQAA